MNNHEIVRHLQATFALDTAETLRLMRQSGATLDAPALESRLEVDFAPLSAREVTALLDGLILERRGPRPGGEAPAAAGAPPHWMSNLVLKKLRIALDYKEADVSAAFARGGVPLQHNELGALFRQEGHKNFRACTDAQLLAFLRGVKAGS